MNRFALILALTAGMTSVALAQEPPRPRPDALVQDGENAPNASTDAAGDVDETEQQPLAQHGLAGPYLAARMAITEGAYDMAANYFQRSLALDPTNLYLADGALLALVSAGRVEEAMKLADQFAQKGESTELVGLIHHADLAKRGAWDELLAQLEARGAATEDDLLNGMIRSWALLGAGRASDALANFEVLSKKQGVGAVVGYHLALARALVGDYEGAQGLLSEIPPDQNILALIAQVQILAQLERGDEALALLNQIDGIEAEPQLLKMREQLEKGQPIPFDVVTSPAEGLAQILLTFATALSSDPEPQPLGLIHARLAAALAPENGAVRLTVAQLLQDLGQFDLAEAEFEALRRMGEMRPAAELSRIEALASVERLDEAQTAALALTSTYPDLPEAWIALGDLLRQQEEFKKSVPAYDKALNLLKDAPEEQRWFPLYARGIALERAGEFERAEADLQAAIEIRPDQASLLNYLGYSWIDRNKNLEQGLELIEKAVSLSPEDGYILDSLAWAYYRLGRYDEAVAPMEKAIGTMASDPLVNDHLGDIYWMVGRKREAEIQWKRVLSLKPSESGEVDLDKVRKKLDHGLEAAQSAEASSDKKDTQVRSEAESPDAAAQ